MTRWESFTNMMTNMITVMEYTPKVEIWHVLNHYAPCVGLKSYHFKPEESLQFCDCLKLRMNELSDFVEPSLFILPHEYRTKKAQQLRSPKRKSEPTYLQADLIKTIEKIQTQEITNDGNAGYAIMEDMESVQDNADQYFDEVQSETSSVASEYGIVENPWTTRNLEDEDANDQRLIGLIKSNTHRREAVELHV
jgi:hypothetical protein